MYGRVHRNKNENTMSSKQVLKSFSIEEKNKQSIISGFEYSSSVKTVKRIKKPTYENIDRAVLKWFEATRTQNLPISGCILKAKSKEFSENFEEHEFQQAMVGSINGRKDIIIMVCICTPIKMYVVRAMKFFVLTNLGYSSNVYQKKI